MRLLAAVILLTACTSAASQAASPDAARSHWVGAWASSQLRLDDDTVLDPPAGDFTLRQIVRLSIGGSRVRVRVANTFGSTPLEIAGVHIAQSRGAGSGGIVPATDTTLTFGGEARVTVPAGASYLSDAVAFSAEPLTDVAITMRLSELPAPQTGHPGSRTTSFLLGGDHLSDAGFPGAERVTRWHQLAGVEVLAPGAAAIVVLGDSITDGHGSTTDGNDRWTDFLVRRLLAHAETRHLGVLNQGIGGNRLLHDGIGANALARFDRDVLAQTGVSYLIVLEGVNDLGMLVRSGDATAERRDALVDGIIGAYVQMIERAHAHGIRVFGGTILPYCGSEFYACTPASEAARRALNAWIRTSGRFDAVIDFDAALRDPAAPDRLLPAYDSGDHLHPSPAGFRAMAEAVPLSLFGLRRGEPGGVAGPRRDPAVAAPGGPGAP